MTLQSLSGGRFILGLGPSGPQVVEGWYGTTYAKPLTRMREYIDIVRQVFAREAPVQYDGYHYRLPYRDEDSTGLGKPLKSILHGDPNTKIYTAAITAGGIRLAAELADGFFPVWMNPERYDLFVPAIDAGLVAAKNGKSRADFDVAPFVRVLMDDDLGRCRNVVKRELALYIGGNGRQGQDFYNDYARRLGYEEAAGEIQDLYLSGSKPEAVAAVPDRLVDDVSLVGPPDRIRDHLARWKEAEKGETSVPSWHPVHQLRRYAFWRRSCFKMKFRGNAFKNGKFWLADIPFLKLMTQGRTKKELLLMVEDMFVTLADKEGLR